MGVLLAKAMGNHVTVISSSSRKESMAMSMGADKLLVSSDTEAMKSSARSIDLILDTISANHDIRPLVDLLKKKGTTVQLGLAIQPFQIGAFKLLTDQVKITGSSVGGMKITQECINFIAEKNLQIKTKTLESIEEVEDAMKVLEKGNDGG